MLDLTPVKDKKNVDKMCDVGNVISPTYCADCCPYRVNGDDSVECIRDDFVKYVYTVSDGRGTINNGAFNIDWQISFVTDTEKTKVLLK